MQRAECSVTVRQERANGIVRQAYQCGLKSTRGGGSSRNFRGSQHIADVFNEAREIKPEFEHAAAAIQTLLPGLAKRLLSKELETRGLSVNQAPPLRDDISVVGCRLNFK